MQRPLYSTPSTSRPIEIYSLEVKWRFASPINGERSISLSSSNPHRIAFMEIICSSQARSWRSQYHTRSSPSSCNYRASATHLKNRFGCIPLVLWRTDSRQWSSVVHWVSFDLCSSLIQRSSNICQACHWHHLQQHQRQWNWPWRWKSSSNLDDTKTPSIFSSDIQESPQTSRWIWLWKRVLSFMIVNEVCEFINDYHHNRLPIHSFKYHLFISTVSDDYLLVAEHAVWSVKLYREWSRSLAFHWIACVKSSLWF